jgi:hypothetical protein
MADTAVSHTPDRRLRSLALTLLALGLASVPAAAPYLFGDGLPRTNDALPHLYRVVVLDRMVQAGQLWPRWLPDLVHGYGYPVFNFSPPFAHWLVELLYLAGLPVTLAYRLAVFAHFWLGMVGAYFLGRRWFGPAAGWALAIAFTYSPYLLYDAHVRGGLQESQALAILPWLLLALSEAARGRRRWIALSALAFAASILSHYPVTFQAMIPTGIWLLFLAWRQGWQTLVGPAVGLSLGALLSAFSWLPSLTEMGYTQADWRISQGYNYAGNFLSLRQMLAWPNLPADPALLNPPVVRALPVVALLLAALGLLWGRRRLVGQRRWQALIWAALLLLSVWFITPASRLAWESLPLLAETFYPWRFLGVASLAGAILLALGVHLVSGESRRSLLLLGAVTTILVSAAIPWLFPPREPVASDPGLAELYQFEAPPLFIGTTTVGEFLPRWVEELPDTTALRAEQLATGDAERLVPAEGATFHRLGGPAWDAAYHIQAQQPATLTYRQFYFPGWRAKLDGEPLSLAPSEPHGLITFAVPPGEHELRLTFGSTPPRRLGWLLAALGAAGILLVVAGPLRRFRPRQRREENEQPLSRPAAELILAALVVALWLFFSYVETPLRRATLGEMGVAGRPALEPHDFAGEIRLLSLETPGAPVAAGDPIPITLSLRALRPIGVPYLFGVDVVDDAGIVWSAARERPADWRFIAGEDVWPLDGYRIEPFVLRLLDGTPPGAYRLRIGLVREDTGQTVALHEAGRLVVDRPARDERPLEDGMVAHEEAVTAGLRLLGWRTDRQESAPGDPVRVTLLWQVEDPDQAAGAGEVSLQLAGDQGPQVVAVTQPLAGAYLPAQWQRGDRLRTEVVLRLPASVPGGEYVWGASLPAAGSQAPSWLLGSLRVHAPERSYTIPPVDIPLDSQLGQVATLLGATLSPPALTPGGALDVTLVWRAEEETAVSYHVFLHLLGPDGTVIAQSDGEPAGWTRPTTGWLPGEIISDERQLALPPGLPAGDYLLTAGLYEPGSNARLQGPGGADTVLIGRLAYP